MRAVAPGTNVSGIRPKVVESMSFEGLKTMEVPGKNCNISSRKLARVTARHGRGGTAGHVFARARRPHSSRVEGPNFNRSSYINDSMRFAQHGNYQRTSSEHAIPIYITKINFAHPFLLVYSASRIAEVRVR